ncbi:50S ribosomal protein L27 [Chenggangzhangella methanolivorans]|uniref:50S ribosomal protein L27 n=1 Tax=Chenggangzhangella methanolivorans TaxID=1437009 RepID=UPI0021BD7A04|nr:50S ribosomal protein L27 [Chenggangzhangella methanolivorans]
MKKQAVRPATAATRPAAVSVKKFGGEAVIPGNIVVRQRGTKWHPGLNIGMGKDHTLFATAEGKVQFTHKANGRTYVNVVPAAMAEAAE